MLVIRLLSWEHRASVLPCSNKFNFSEHPSGDALRSSLTRKGEVPGAYARRIA